MKNSGSSPPYILIILVLSGISFYFFGWITIAVLGGIFLIITIGTIIHDYFKPPIPLNQRGYCEEVGKNTLDPFEEVNEAIKYVDSFKGKPEEFELAVSDNLQDPAGMNMALITDRILAKGWEPGSYEQKDGYRVYFYKDTE